MPGPAVIQLYRFCSSAVFECKDMSSFETVLAECHSIDPLEIRQIFKSEQMCRICQLKVRTTKHLASISHRRKEMCVQLFVLQREMSVMPSSESMTKLRNLLQTKRTEDCYLLSTHTANWPVLSNTGLDDQRGKLRDSSRIWFLNFLSDMEKICQSLQATEMSSIAEDIIETISTFRLKKLEPLDPLMKVVLPWQGIPTSYLTDHKPPRIHLKHASNSRHSILALHEAFSVYRHGDIFNSSRSTVLKFESLRATHLLLSSICANPCAVARPQERVLAVAMASHTRLGADSPLGRLLPSELLRAVARRVDAK
jgi:hypothetical protein